MADPFLGQISIFSFAFPPAGYALCNGQTLPINQNQALFNLLGTVYGGDGSTNFALPDLRGRTPWHVGSNSFSEYQLGQAGGEEAVALTEAQIPPHTHTLNATPDMADIGSPANALPAQTSIAVAELYAGSGAITDVTLLPEAIAGGGSGNGHDNMQPTLTLNFCIALSGAVPSPN